MTHLHSRMNFKVTKWQCGDCEPEMALPKNQGLPKNDGFCPKMKGSVMEHQIASRPNEFMKIIWRELLSFCFPETA
jgi:hypothetical protein